MHIQHLRGFHTIFKRDLMNLVLNPVLIFSNSIFPIILILVLSYMGSGIYSGGEVSSYDYYGITIMIFMVLNVSMTASNSFMERSILKSNLRILYSPLPASFIYVSKIAATFIFTSMGLLFISAWLGLVFGVNLGGSNAVYVLLILIIFNLFSSAFGVMFCCIFKSEETTNKLLSLINNICALIGGLFFQWDGLGKTAEAISNLSPVKWVADGIFQIIYDHDFGLFLPALTVCVGGTAVLVWICKLTFKAEDYV